MKLSTSTCTTAIRWLPLLQLQQNQETRTGSAISGERNPVLFNFYMSTFPPTLKDLKIGTYADYITLIATGTGPSDTNEICDRTNSYVNKSTNTPKFNKGSLMFFTDGSKWVMVLGQESIG